MDVDKKPPGQAYAARLDFSDPRADIATDLLTESGYSGNEDKSGPLHSFVEHTMTFLFPAFLAVNLYLAAREFEWFTLIAVIIIAAPLAWVLADFGSGLVHWFADTYGTARTPLFGPWLIKPFRHHHVYPRDICTHGVVLTIGNSCTAAVPFQAGLLYLMVSDEEISGAQAFLALVFNLFSAAIVATNLFHKWAHAEKNNRLVLVLQRTRLLLSTDHHNGHHSGVFDSNYCITNGWLNGALDKIQFFRRTEIMLARIGVRSDAASNEHALPESFPANSPESEVG